MRHLVETVSRVYAHWLRDDRDVPAAVLDRVLAPGDALRARDEPSDAGSVTCSEAGQRGQVDGEPA